jgi:malic enzyme
MALSVTEGRAALPKRFADVWPMCLDTQETDTIVEFVKAIAPIRGGMSLEDIAAPRCFEIETPMDRPSFGYCSTRVLRFGGGCRCGGCHI